MASHTPSRQLLDELNEDRVRLRHRVGMPRWLAPTIGVFAAAWVASPAVGNETSDNAYTVSLVGILLAVYLATRAAGVRHGGLRARGLLIIGVATLVGLVLYSTSLGLVSLDLRWWVVLPALAAAAVGHGATHLVERESLARLTGGR